MLQYHPFEAVVFQLYKTAALKLPTEAVTAEELAILRVSLLKSIQLEI
jgi:hypothetical protein